MIHNPNITFISYIPNITPLAFLEPLASFEPLESSTNILNTTYAFIYLATISTIDPLIYLTTLVSFAYFTILEYLEPILDTIKPVAYLAPLAILAFLTFITLLINASKVIKDASDASDTSATYVVSDTSSDDTSSVGTDDTTDSETDDYTSSKIEECKVVNREGVIVSDKKKYRGILVDIWKTMEKQDILENTTFKFKNGNKRGVKGYNWCEEIDMSFQSRDANATLREILHLVKVNNLAIDLSITLKTDETVRFNIE